MESILKNLFEYQKFDENAELRSVIDSVHARWTARELNLDEMEQVAAAGIPERPAKKDKEKNNRP